MAEQGKRRGQAKAKSAPKGSAKSRSADAKPRPRSSKRPSAQSAGDFHRRISERAFYLFLERGAEHGSDLEDWLTAESVELQG